MSKEMSQDQRKQVKVMLAGKSERFAQFRESLAGQVSGLYQEESGQAVLDSIAAENAQIVVIDEQLADMDGAALVNTIAKLHPFVNTALVSTLEEDDFHEETEGLGVLMQLPSPPDAESAERLLAHYRSIWG